jgi:FAS-associated factor 2
MSAAELDLDQLSPSERTALDTYTSVTGQDLPEAIPLLRRSQWNVQVGALLRASK